MDRNQLEKLCASHLEKFAQNIQQTLQKSGLQVSDLTSIEAVGGGLRIPLIQEKAKQALGGRDLSFTLDTAHCVAEGAAILAKLLKPEFGLTFAIEGEPSLQETLESKFSNEELNELIKVNSELRANVRLIQLENETRNALEAYIFEKNSQVEKKYANLVKPEVKKN